MAGLDLALFDAIGWNLQDDIAGQRDYRYSTLNIPEPGALALLALSLATLGLLRRRRER